jgi:hypothetical protein
MNGFKHLALALVAGACLAGAASEAQAQPSCQYGFYGYAPYACAPYGYYGPEWFEGGAFIGAGPWGRGHDNFHGHADNHFGGHMGHLGGGEMHAGVGHEGFAHGGGGHEGGGHGGGGGHR